MSVGCVDLRSKLNATYDTPNAMLYISSRTNNLLGCISTHFLDLKVRVGLPAAAVGSGSFFVVAFLPVILLTIPPFEAVAFFVTIVEPLLNSEPWLSSLERGCFDSDGTAAARLTRTVPVFAA